MILYRMSINQKIENNIIYYDIFTIKKLKKLQLKFEGIFNEIFGLD